MLLGTPRKAWIVVQVDAEPGKRGGAEVVQWEHGIGGREDVLRRACLHHFGDDLLEADPELQDDDGRDAKLRRVHGMRAVEVLLTDGGLAHPRDEARALELARGYVLKSALVLKDLLQDPEAARHESELREVANHLSHALRNQEAAMRRMLSLVGEGV